MISRTSRQIAKAVPFSLLGARFSSLIFAAFACVLLMISASSEQSFESLKTNTADIFSPAISLVNKPFYELSEYARTISGLSSLQEENLRLQQENIRLREWYQKALTLQADNADLKALLNVKMPKSYHFVSGKVIADVGSVFAKTLLVEAGVGDGVEKGQAVLNENGLLGRVVEAGQNASRILLLTDINSRVPVMLEQTNRHAILAGNNDKAPYLMHLSEDAYIEDGERIITSGNGGVFPYGLAVGEVVRSPTGDYLVKPFASAENAHMVRIVNKDSDPNLIKKTP